MPKLQWHNLQDGLCPKCGAHITLPTLSNDWKCTSAACNFTIADERFRHITSSIASGARHYQASGLSDEEMRQQELNNL